MIALPVNASFYHRFPVIETPHLRLRELTPDDAEVLFEMFHDPEVTRFYDVVTMTDLDQARALTERLRRRFLDRNGIRWAIERTRDGRMVGTCGYPVIVASAHRGSIGYELVRHAWGHGLATEATEAVEAITASMAPRCFLRFSARGSAWVHASTITGAVRGSPRAS